MAKPICVVYLPENVFPNGKLVTWKDCNEMIKNFDEAKPDYHWFFFPDNSADKIEFKVFYEKDFTEIKYEELKTLITNAIEETKTATNKKH